MKGTIVFDNVKRLEDFLKEIVGKNFRSNYTAKSLHGKFSAAEIKLAVGYGGTFMEEPTK